MKRTFSRQEMYDLVWSTPIQKLAEQYGLSDRGLAKTCQRHQVPVPGRGYWAKIEAGHPVNKTPLAKLNNPGLEPVHIGGFKREVNPYVAFALEQAKARQTAKAPIERPQPKEEVVAASAPTTDELPETQPSPSPRKIRTHSSVESLARELRSSKPDYDGYVSVRWIRISPASIGRVVELLSRLATELEPDGIELSASGSRVNFKEGPTEVDFEITSPRKQVMTETKYGWKQREYIHTGRLCLRIFARADGGIKKNWADKDEKIIEGSIAQIAESFRLWLVAQRAEDDARRVEEQRRAELARRRDLAKKRAEREDFRLKFLTGVADARREAEDLRCTIDLIPDGDQAQPHLLRMLDWAKKRLAFLDQNTLPGAIQRDLVERNLFPEPDDLHDPEGDPPPQRSYWD